MERSLFERLQQQGAPVKMLSVQYRMHPAIRQVGCCLRRRLRRRLRRACWQGGVRSLEHSNQCIISKRGLGACRGVPAKEHARLTLSVSSPAGDRHARRGSPARLAQLAHHETRPSPHPAHSTPPPPSRQFPSAHFYGGRLRDADSIRDMPPAPFYTHPLMKPYVLFDVARGQERRREGGGSLSNRVCAGGGGRATARASRFALPVWPRRPNRVRVCCAASGSSIKSLVGALAPAAWVHPGTSGSSSVQVLRAGAVHVTRGSSGRRRRSALAGRGAAERQR